MRVAAGRAPQQRHPPHRPHLPISTRSLTCRKLRIFSKFSLHAVLKTYGNLEDTVHKLTMVNFLAEAGLADDALADADNPLDPIKLRPDGYYWTDPQGRMDFGPFESLELALADMGDDDEAPEPGETLQEAENEIGIAEWIDPDTGAPAEGQAHPRIED